MGRLFIEYLSGVVFCCKCGCHLTSENDLLSKNFHSRNGIAYLFDSATNVAFGPLEEREMTTGKHHVRNLFCVSCNTSLGWRYEFALERREKYKEGKYVLEKAVIMCVEERGSPAPSSLGGAFDTLSLLSDVEPEDSCYL